MSLAHDSQVSDWAEPFPGANYLRQTMAVAEADVRKLVHDPVELFTRMVQPVLWLLIFGQVFNRTRAIPTGGISYLDFMAPGILAQSVLFGAIFYGISLIWERDLGIVQKFLVSPAPRSALVLGRAISSTVRGLSQMGTRLLWCSITVRRITSPSRMNFPPHACATRLMLSVVPRVKMISSGPAAPMYSATRCRACS